jgi:purine-nucleoside phosphorylase
METLAQRIRESVASITQHPLAAPRVALILGSGLGDFADTLKGGVSIRTADIPHYPISTVEGHKGSIIFASLNQVPLAVFQGRVHFYECDSAEAVVYPVCIAYALGARIMIITNAAGGVNRQMSPGDLMAISDQINLTTETASYDQLQVKRSYSLYDRRLLALAQSVSTDLGIQLHQGVYVGVKGPSYETAAEVEMVNRIGGDAVGMSTVLEARLAGDLQMRVLGISCITNKATGIGTSKLNHQEVTEAANKARHHFSRLLEGVIGKLGGD